MAQNIEALPSNAFPSRAELLELYKLTIQEGQFQLDEQQKRVAFFSGLLSAILGGTVAGALQADTPIECFLLIPGPVMMFGLGGVARRGAYRFYRRYLESVTTRAKLEYWLGMHGAGETDDDQSWVATEPLIPVRHRTSRRSKNANASRRSIGIIMRRVNSDSFRRRDDNQVAIDNSGQFVELNGQGGYQRITDELFAWYKVAAGVLTVGLIALALAKAGLIPWT